MGNKMLIDATHPEETRVVVTRGNRVEEFDYESAARKQLRGNIYLAKIARIEPSLQAAFVNYGGNRHGFLAFAEIHPDYYQIPVAVREAIMREEALERQRSSENGDDGVGEAGPKSKPGGTDAQNGPEALDGGEAAFSGELASEGAPEPEAAEDRPASDPRMEASFQSATTADDSPAGPFKDETQRPRQAPIPLEAALPPVIYEEFTAAVARAEEARDEIP